MKMSNELLNYTDQIKVISVKAKYDRWIKKVEVYCIYMYMYV